MCVLKYKIQRLEHIFFRMLANNWNSQLYIRIISFEKKKMFDLIYFYQSEKTIIYSCILFFEASLLINFSIIIYKKTNKLEAIRQM